MPNISEMSDEDFLSLGVPAAVEQRAAELEANGNTPDPDEEAARVAAEEEAARTAAEEQAAADAAAAAKTGEEGGTTPDPEDGNVLPADKTNGQAGAPADGSTPPVKEEGKPDNTNPDGAAGGSSTAQVDGKTPATEVVPDYKADYEKIMAPFIANGREIKLKSPAEAVQLMQMGANYTRKMQELAPHRRVLTMLQNNKLTDENQLAFLIDLSRGDKGAIQKLLKDSGIDPRDIDVDSESTYQGGNHYVTDKQVDFQSTVDDLKGSEQGQATIAAAAKWDQASIDAVGNDPSILRAIHDQRISGVYDLVANEVERRRTLGAIPSSVPFLHAYQMVGNEMAEQERQAKAQAAPPVQPAQPVPVAKTVVQPKAQVANGDKAKAATSSRSSAGKAASTPINPLAMSDEAFMKEFANFQGRV